MRGGIIRLDGRPLVVLSDVHIGAEEHRGKELAEALAYTKSERAWIVLNGDILENAILSGKAAGDKLLAQNQHPTEQVKAAASALLPHKERILFATRGNHEARTRNSSLLDLSDLLAAWLGVPYWGVGGLARLQSGPHVYELAIHHGRSGAANIWLELDRMLKLYPTADVACLGHNHALDARRVPGITIGPAGEETIRDRWQVRTGSFLGYPDYVRELAIAPGRVGCPIIKFGVKRRRVDVDVETLSWAGI